MKKSIIQLVLFAALLPIFSCSEEEEDMGSKELIEHYHLAGKYLGQVTPALFGIAPITTGEHEMEFTDMGDGRLHLYYDHFQEPPMPFVMTVDIYITVKKAADNTLKLEGEKGTFRADVPEGKTAVDPKDAPPGITIPEGGEKGMISHQAAIIGNYGEIEKKGKKAERFDLKLSPGLPLPVRILIYTHHKIN